VSEFRTFLAALEADLRQYQVGFRRVFSLRLNLPGHCAKYFLDMLTVTTRLYSDNLQLRRFEPKFEERERSGEVTCTPTVIHRSPQGWNVSELSRGCLGETAIIKKFERRIESLPLWTEFNPINEFFEENGLRTLADYTGRLVSNLPDIYGESIDLRDSIKGLLGRAGIAATLQGLSVGLEHAAHHASYCRHALGILSNENSWWGKGH
jgi:hypothetical protein